MKRPALEFLGAGFLRENTEEFLTRKKLAPEDLWKESVLRSYVGTLPGPDRVRFLLLVREGGPPTARVRAEALLRGLWEDSGARAWFAEALDAEFAPRIRDFLSEEERRAWAPALPKRKRKLLGVDEEGWPPEVLERARILLARGWVYEKAEAWGRSPLEEFLQGDREAVRREAVARFPEPSERDEVFRLLEWTWEPRRYLEAETLGLSLLNLFPRGALRRTPEGTEWNDRPNPGLGGLTPREALVGPGPLEVAYLRELLALSPGKAPQKTWKAFLDEEADGRPRREQIKEERARLLARHPEERGRARRVRRRARPRRR